MLLGPHVFSCHEGFRTLPSCLGHSFLWPSLLTSLFLATHSPAIRLLLTYDFPGDTSLHTCTGEAWVIHDHTAQCSLQHLSQLQLCVCVCVYGYVTVTFLPHEMVKPVCAHHVLLCMFSVVVPAPCLSLGKPGASPCN